MKKIFQLLLILSIGLFLVACNEKPPVVIEDKGPDQYDTIAEKVEWWLNHLTLDEKVGQMIQAERSNNGSGITPAKAKALNIGSILITSLSDCRPSLSNNSPP